LLLLILGAGASFDSVHGGPPSRFRPPLARELFAERGEGSVFSSLLKKYRDVRTIAGEVRAVVARDSSANVEAILERYQARWYLDRQARVQLLTLRLYLRDLLQQLPARYLDENSHVTNFHALVELIERERTTPVSVVTFNYDTLFERAAMDRALMSIVPDGKGHPGGYIDGAWKLYKLHGSVNWVRLTRLTETFGMSEDANDSRARALVPDDAGALTDEYMHGPRSNHYQNIVSVPAIAIPIRSKDGFECPPSFVADLRESLPLTTRVLSIGWRGTEGDFLQMLKDLLPADVPFDLVSGSKPGATGTIAALQAAGITSNFRYLDGGFSRLIEESALLGRLMQSSEFEPV
jgi:hypothetical protein